MVAWLRALGLALVFGLATGGAAEAKWLRAETAHFVLYSDGRERQLRDFAAQLEVFHEALLLFHPATPGAPPSKLDIYIVEDAEALGRVWPGASGLGGFYSADPEATLILARRDDEDFAYTVLFHEYTHHFMLHNYAYPYPRWLVEGWAEYFGATRVYRDRIELGLPSGDRASAVGDWYLSTKDLFGKRMADLPGGSISAFYARAYLLTHYMMSDDTRRRQLNSYTRLVGEGGDTIETLEKVLGHDMATLDRRLREYYKSRVPYTSIKREKVEIPVTISALTPAADDILLERVRLLTGVRSKEARGALENIKFRAKRHQDDRLAQLTLARAHIMLGDPADAEPILAPYIADGKDWEALYLMGLRYSRMAKKELGLDQRKAEAEEKAEKLKGKEDTDPPPPEIVPDPQTRARVQEWHAKARPWLIKANHANPNSYQVLFAFAQGRAFDDDYPSDATIRMLAAAYDLAPQVDEVTFASAQALIAKQRQAEAIRLLNLLANKPHGGTMSKRAKAMLEQLGQKTDTAN